MQKESKQSGARATNSFRKRFQNSLFSITFLYTATLIVILFISSFSIHAEFSNRIAKRFRDFSKIPTQMINRPTAQEVRDDLFESLLFTNLILIFLASFSSYWLARKTLKPIKDAYERQQRFLSDASHELRTPLSILTIELENEIMSTLKTHEKNNLQSKLDEVKRMTKIVNDLLVLSRLDEERTRTKPTQIHIETSIGSIVKRLQSLAESNGITLSYFHKSDNTVITIDEDLLMHALTNFILNAIVYNRPKGKVEIISYLEKNNFIVEIIDTGIGISKEDLQNIFERFYRTDKSRSRRTGGSGLGLSIAQSAIHHLKGRLEIESEVNIGTKVKVHLPIK
jgi:signal transduction histidine kinase